MLIKYDNWTCRWSGNLRGLSCTTFLGNRNVTKVYRCVRHCLFNNITERLVTRRSLYSERSLEKFGHDPERLIVGKDCSQELADHQLLYNRRKTINILRG